MSIPPRFARYTERAVGDGHPVLQDTINRALKDVIDNSGQDPAAAVAFANINHTHPAVGISFEDYGAVGNGSTDDTVAVQAAITANPSNAIIKGNGKTYKVSTQLTIPNGSTFLEIVNARFIVPGDTSFLAVPNPASDLVTFFRMDGVFIQATGHTTVGRKIIDFSNFGYSTFHRIWILGTDGKTDHFYGKKPSGVPASYYNKIDQVYLGGMRYGINCDDAGLDTGVNALTICDSRIQPSTSRTAVRISRYCQLIRVLNNVLESPGGTGVDFEGKSCEVYGNWFEGLTLGWRMRVNAFDSYVGHNYFSGCATDTQDDTGTPADNYIYVRT